MCTLKSEKVVHLRLGGLLGFISSLFYLRGLHYSLPILSGLRSADVYIVTPIYVEISFLLDFQFLICNSHRFWSTLRR